MLIQKLKEAAAAVAPIVAIVLVLNFTLVPLGTPVLLKFLLGAACIILGLCLFMFGVDISIGPIGQLTGAFMAKTNRTWIVVALGLLLGFLISAAEPDLHILADQVDIVTGGLVRKTGLVAAVSVGIAAMLSLGLVRILQNVRLRYVLTALYAVVLVLAVFTPDDLLAIAFDASGATTGALTVPFILALAMGVSSMKKNSLASENDHFGLVAITSTGAILAVMVMGLLSGAGEISGGGASVSAEVDAGFGIFLQLVPETAAEVLISLLPIILVFLIFQKASFKLSKKRFRSILIGLFYAFLGLVLLLTGVNAGFLAVGRTVGHSISSMGSGPLLTGVGFVLGLVTVLAEPAVHALTNQIETATSGYVRRSTVLAALSLGIGAALALSMLRVLIPGLKLWHILLPGYGISLALSYLVPDLFVGIAFDSGGVASGPMTSTFILAFASGAAEAAPGADVLADGFGVIALVALMPLITLQLLGLIYQIITKVKAGENDASQFREQDV